MKCKYCQQPIVLDEMHIFWAGKREYLHPDLVSESCVGSRCKDGLHEAKPDHECDIEDCSRHWKAQCAACLAKLCKGHHVMCCGAAYCEVQECMEAHRCL